MRKRQFPDTLEVRVLPIDIKDGVKGSSTHCAVARALKRKFRKATPDVGGSVATVEYVEQDGSYQFAEYSMPEEAGEFIRRFDDSKPVEPATFELKLRDVERWDAEKSGEELVV